MWGLNLMKQPTTRRSEPYLFKKYSTSVENLSFLDTLEVLRVSAYGTAGWVGRGMWSKADLLISNFVLFVS